MTEIFTNYNVYSNGKMKKLNQSQIHQARLAGHVPEPSHGDSRRLANLLQMAEMTEEEADEIFKCTNCLSCCYPKSHAKNHHMTKCPFLKKYGITCTHDFATDQQISEASSEQGKQRRKKNATLDGEDEKKATKINKKAKAKKKKDADDAAAKEKTEAEAAGMATVGTDGKYTKTQSEAQKSIQRNLDSQTPQAAGSGRAAGVARAVGELGCFRSNDYGGTSFVDASTACNDVNDDVNG